MKDTEKIQENAKIKKTDLSTVLSIVIPLVLIFGFLIGGAVLFRVMFDSRYEPDETYLKSEMLIEERLLIGLTLEKCEELIGLAVTFEEGNAWIFPGGRRWHPEIINPTFYQLCVFHEDGVAVRARLRVSEIPEDLWVFQ
jgi:hypothetical protein